MRAANWLAALLVVALGSGRASAQVINCTGVADVFASRLALIAGAMDENGAFLSLRRVAQEDLRSCPDLEPQRYYLARMAELGYSATGARRTAVPDIGARALAEELLRRHPLSARIATIAARLNGSVEVARRAVALDPGYAPARTALAAALAAAGDTSGAAAILAAARSSQSAANLIVRARINLAAGDAKGAFADALVARDARQKEPEPTPSRDILRDAEELLGLSSRALGRSSDARKHLERAASLGSVTAREALVEIAPSSRQGKRH